MVRVTTTSNVLAGIGLAILGFSIVLRGIFKYFGEASAWPFYTWAIGAALLAVVVLLSVINTFTEMTGFVHPEDKLVSNMFVFLMAIATVLILGHHDEGSMYANSLFDMASMIVIAYVFLFIFVYFSQQITEGSEMGQVKEMTARFMLVSLLLGAIMAGLLFVFTTIRDTIGSYELAAIALGAFAIALVIGIVVFLGRRYEPVGE